MNVKQLISMLKQYPPETNVVVCLTDGANVEYSLTVRKVGIDYQYVKHGTVEIHAQVSQELN